MTRYFNEFTTYKETNKEEKRVEPIEANEDESCLQKKKFIIYEICSTNHMVTTKHKSRVGT